MEKDLSLIFERKPAQWGLRGDPYLWDEMRELCVADSLDIDDYGIARFVCEYFEKTTGQPLTIDAKVYVERLAQFGIFVMTKPVGETRSVNIANSLVDYLSSILGKDLSKLKNSYNDSDSMAKRQCLVSILSSVLNASIDKEEFDPSIVSADIDSQLQSLALGGEFDQTLKLSCVSEVSGKCPFCNHELVSSAGDNVIETYRIIKFPASDHFERFEYIAVCSNCFERYKQISDRNVLRSLQEKKKTILSKKSFDKSVDALEMEEEIGQVLDALVAADPNSMTKFQYAPAGVRDKIPDDNMLYTKIWSNVVQYFPFVEDKLRQLNNEKKLTYEKISGDIKRAYLEFASNENSKEVIFNQLCEWLAGKAQTDKKSACEVIISYYVQNCEVFEREIAK